MPAPVTVWTEEKKQELAELTKRGVDPIHIGERWGLAPRHILNVQGRLGFAAKRADAWPEEKIARLRELAADNSAAKIGKILGLSRNAIIGKAHRLGIRLNIKYNQGEANRARAGIRPKTYKPRKERRVTAHNGVHGSRLFEFVDVSNDLPASAADNPCSLIDIPANGCHWPCEGEGFATVFCGGNAVEGMSYCARHCRMAYRPVR